MEAKAETSLNFISSKLAFSLALILTLLILSTSAFASSYVPEDVIYNNIYDNGVFFDNTDYQSFYVGSPITLNDLTVIGKAKDGYATTSPILKIYNNNVTSGGTPKDLLYTTVSTSQISNTNFKNINYDLEDLNLSVGYYWILLDFGVSEHNFYSDTSAIDTYINGGINNISSSKDLYFVFTGKYDEAVTTEINIEKSDLLKDILGENSFIILLVSIGLLIGVTVLVSKNIPLDFITLLVVGISSILLYLIGMLSFYLAGFFIASDIVCYMWGGRNENK